MHLLKRLFILSIAIAFILVKPFGTEAWNETGHKVAAEIAWNYITPTAKTKMIQILEYAPRDSDIPKFFDESAPNRDELVFVNGAFWPDMVKDRNKPERKKKYDRGHWHYIGSYWEQTENGPQNAQGPVDPENVIERIELFRKTLSSVDTPIDQKALQIIWIAHLIGDIHQPMHGVSKITEKYPEGDAGGNYFSLGEGWPRNLHSYWDGAIDVSLPREKGEEKFDYVKLRASEIMAKYPPEFFGKEMIQNQNQVTWQQDSKAYVMSHIYPKTLIEGEKPGDDYKKMAFDKAQQQLAIAGYRMAEFFNLIFDPKSKN